MAHVQISFDDPTLAILRPPAHSRIPEDFVRLVALLAAFVQTLAILATGAWVCYLYITYQRASNAYALQIAGKQLEQARLGLQQAERTLEQSGYDLRKSQIELGRIVQTPLVITHQIRITPLAPAHRGKRLYLASYYYTFTNSANVPVEISYLVADAFLAHAPPHPLHALAVNDVTTGSPLAWEPVLQAAFICRDDWQPGMKLRVGQKVVEAEHCGAGTGKAKSGETLQGEAHVLLSGTPRDLIKFRIRITIGGTTRIDIKDLAPLRPENRS
jgi:hypothetical protein